MIYPNKKPSCLGGFSISNFLDLVFALSIHVAIYPPSTAVGKIIVVVIVIKLEGRINSHNLLHQIRYLLFNHSKTALSIPCVQRLSQKAQFRV